VIGPAANNQRDAFALRQAFRQTRPPAGKPQLSARRDIIARRITAGTSLYRYFELEIEWPKLPDY
jgi:hypothetical protein